MYKESLCGFTSLCKKKKSYEEFMKEGKSGFYVLQMTLFSIFCGIQTSDEHRSYHEQRDLSQPDKVVSVTSIHMICVLYLFFSDS